MDQLFNTLLRVLNLIYKNLGIYILNNNGIIIKSNNQTLLELRNNTFMTFDPKIPSIFQDQKSKLSDSFVDQKLLQNFLLFLKKKNSSIHMNHIGYCYQISSMEKEVIRLTQLTKEKNIPLYKDRFSKEIWLYFGDKNDRDIPLIEYIPMTKVTDYYKDYWLPHIHICLETKLDIDTIKYGTHTLFDGQKTANPAVIIRGIIFQLRIWLGIIQGVNICLDLTTDNNDLFSYNNRFLDKIT